MIYLRKLGILFATVCNCDFGHLKTSQGQIPKETARASFRTDEAFFCWSLFLDLSWKPQNGECVGKKPVGLCRIGVLDDQLSCRQKDDATGRYQPQSAASVSTRELSEFSWGMEGSPSCITFSPGPRSSASQFAAWQLCTPKRSIGAEAQQVTGLRSTNEIFVC